MAQDEQDAYRTFLRLAQASQDHLNAGWLATPAASAASDVPDAVARVDAGLANLQDQLGEVLLAAPQAVGGVCRTIG
ncbi:hypothetical protein ACFV0H_34460 [Streptomyces erythrochromogenes]|uniref:hypothetical protein n=1 Tax=Streptomyces erythrochromogenes TaxID=285574 RepID=UPI0036AA7513